MLKALHFRYRSADTPAPTAAAQDHRSACRPARRRQPSRERSRVAGAAQRRREHHVAFDPVPAQRRQGPLGQFHPSVRMVQRRLPSTAGHRQFGTHPRQPDRQPGRRPQSSLAGPRRHARAGAPRRPAGRHPARRPPVRRGRRPLASRGRSPGRSARPSQPRARRWQPSWRRKDASVLSANDASGPGGRCAAQLGKVGAGAAVAALTAGGDRPQPELFGRVRGGQRPAARVVAEGGGGQRRGVI